MPEPIFNKIEAALNALDASTGARIQNVDEQLRALGVTIEAFLAEPADVWNDVRLQLGYARIAGRYCLVVRRVRGDESTVEALGGADRATRIAVVDRLPALLDALEAELRRRSARLAPAGTERTPIEIKTAAPAPPPQAKTSAAAPPPAPAAAPALAVKPSVTAAPGVSLPPVSEVDAPLHASAGNGGNQESMDHMFRLFSRKGK